MQLFLFKNKKFRYNKIRSKKGIFFLFTNRKGKKLMSFDFDVVIIGAGVTGCAIADELAKRKVKVAVLERNLQVAQETSEGNSGIIHGGFDPTPGKLNATLNIEGNKLFQETWFKELDFPWKKVDSLVLAMKKTEMLTIQTLYNRGLTNGVNPNNLKILTKAETLALEPNVNPTIQGALLCTTSYIVDPVLLTHSLIKRAIKHDAKLLLNHEVIKITALNHGFNITAINNNQSITITSNFVINAAGHYADVIANMINCHDFTLKARRGQYCILAKSETKMLNNHILFMAPRVYGKGIIVAPLTNGHILVGPTAVENVAKTETRLITIKDIKLIQKIGLKIIPNLKVDHIAKVFSGSRSICNETDDFFINRAKNNANFINVAGIKSPGLSSAPAVALKVADMIKKTIK